MRRFRLLEKALLSRLFRPLEHHHAVSSALDGFRSDNMPAVVRRLARNTGLSDRRFIDVFRFEVGLKPKLFNRVQRFQRVLSVVHRTPSPDWAQLALDHGYFESIAPDLRRLNGVRREGQHVKFNHLPLAR
jgi:hypothetical protein